MYIDAGSVAATSAAATGGGFENLVVNPAPAVTDVTDTIDTTTVVADRHAERGRRRQHRLHRVVDQRRHRSPVTVTLANGATITIAGRVEQRQRQRGRAGRRRIVDAGSVTATIDSASGGKFENLVVDPAPATPRSPTRSTPRRCRLTRDRRVAEGGTIVYTASLTSAAGTPVTVTLSNGAAITIAAGASTGTVSVAAPGDDVYVDAGSVSATISTATGGNFENLAITRPPADRRSPTPSTPHVSPDRHAQRGRRRHHRLHGVADRAGQTPVTVTLANGATITIAAGASSGSVSVAAPGDDVYVDAGSVSATISSASGGNFENLVVNAGAGDTTDHRHHRHHHGEPRPPRRASPKAAASSTPRR